MPIASSPGRLAFSFDASKDLVFVHFSDVRLEMWPVFDFSWAVRTLIANLHMFGFDVWPKPMLAFFGHFTNNTFVQLLA